MLTLSQGAASCAITRSNSTGITGTLQMFQLDYSVAGVEPWQYCFFDRHHGSAGHSCDLDCVELVVSPTLLQFQPIFVLGQAQLKTQLTAVLNQTASCARGTYVICYNSKVVIRLAVWALVLQAAAVGAADADALLQLKGLAAEKSSLQSWQPGSSPCGKQVCALGSCSWGHVACEQGKLSQVDLGGVGLEGSLPTSWQAPASLKVLDLSNNKHLCGSLPATLASSAITVKTEGTSIGQPCAAAGKPITDDKAAAGGVGGLDAPAEQQSGSGLTSLASGLMGAGIGIGVLAGAAAGTMFFLRRRRQQSGQDSLLSHDLARTHDSVIVTKQKKRVKTTAPTAVIVQGDSGAPSAPGGEASTSASSPRIRAVAFTDGAGSELVDEDKQRLRAANIQDSVVIIRNKLASGQLSSGHVSSHKLDGAVGSEHSWSSEEDEASVAEPERGSSAGEAVHAAHPAQDAVLTLGAAAPAQHEHHAVHVEHPSALHQPALLQLQQSPSKRVQFSGAMPAAVLDP